MDRESYNNIKKPIKEELAQDRIDVTRGLNEEYSRKGTFIGDTAAEDKAREDAAKQERLETELARRETVRKQLHFSDESYEDVGARLRREEAAQRQQAALQQQQDKKKKEEQARQLAEQSKTQKLETARQRYRNEFAQASNGKNVTDPDIPIDTTQAREELSREEKMAEYDRRMKEHFNQAREREQDTDLGR